MAGMDYANCDSCGRGKIFYDANVDWESFGGRIGQIRIVCNECYDKGQRINLKKNLVPDDMKEHINCVNWGIQCWTSEGKEYLKNKENK